MVSLARAAAAVARSALRQAPVAGRALGSPLPAVPSSSPARAARILRRSAAAASAGLETLMPLHTAVAGARLRSCIAVDSSCWSSLSQDPTKMVGIGKYCIRYDQETVLPEFWFKQAHLTMARR